MAKRNPDPFRLVVPATLEVKKAKAAGEKTTLVGYASVFGNVDSYGDIVMPGAFAKSIRERIPAGLVKLCSGHDCSPEGLIGTVRSGVEDAKGLRIVAEVSGSEKAQHVARLIEEGHLDRMSIGYDVVREDYLSDEASGRTIRRLWELKLYECSPVVFAANELADIVGVKGLSRAVPFQDLALAPDAHPWDEKAALERVVAWATQGGALNTARYRRAFALWEPSKGAQPESFRFPVADVVGEQLVVVPEAIRTAERALEEVDDEEADVDAVRAHLARYRAKAKAIQHPFGHQEEPRATMPSDDAAGPPSEAPTVKERERRTRLLDAGLRDLGA